MTVAPDPSDPDEPAAILERIRLRREVNVLVDERLLRLDERLDRIAQRINERFEALDTDKQRNWAEFRGFLLGVIVTLLVVALIALTQVHVKG